MYRIVILYAYFESKWSRICLCVSLVCTLYVVEQNYENVTQCSQLFDRDHNPEHDVLLN
jgi:hypothetical protein